MPVKVNWVFVYVFQNLPFCSVHHDADVIFAYVIFARMESISLILAQRAGKKRPYDDQEAIS